MDKSIKNTGSFTLKDFDEMNKILTKNTSRHFTWGAIITNKRMNQVFKILKLWIPKTTKK